jgi:hypothetical protein
MSIPLPIEVWQLADRYSEALDAINSVETLTESIDEAIELSRQLESSVDHYLTTDVTIETSNGLLLTFYRDPLIPSRVYALTTQQVFRPSFDRPPTNPLEVDRPPSQ